MLIRIKETNRNNPVYLEKKTGKTVKLARITGKRTGRIPKEALAAMGFLGRIQ